MPSKVNTEFNYRFQVIGYTPWEKIKTLKGFLEDRERALQLESLADKKKQFFLKKIEHLKNTNAPEHEILDVEIELQESLVWEKTHQESYDLVRAELATIRKVMTEVYAIAEPTRAKHENGEWFTDEEMYELNQANEFTAKIGMEIYTEIMATGRPSPTKLGNAMSNPHTFKALKQAGLLPDNMQYIEGGIDPLQIGLNVTALQLENGNYTLDHTGIQYPIIESQTTPTVQRIFTTPIYQVKSKIVDEELLAHIKNLEFKDNVKEKTFQSKNNYILNEPYFVELRNFIEEHLKNYAEKIMQVTTKLHITQSWVNVSHNKARHMYHTHPNSIYSGIFYLNFEKGHPPVMFLPPLASTLALAQEVGNEFNCGMYAPNCATGDLLIFPSTIPHQVEENQIDIPRISLSFNTFASEMLGRNESLTELHL